MAISKTNEKQNTYQQSRDAPPERSLVAPVREHVQSRSRDDRDPTELNKPAASFGCSRTAGNRTNAVCHGTGRNLPPESSFRQFDYVGSVSQFHERISGRSQT